MAYLPGELQNLYYVPESAYGVTPTSALVWGARLLSIAPTFDQKKQFDPLPGSRTSYGTACNGAIECSATVRAYAKEVSGGYDWLSLWARYALGSVSGLEEHLPSFSMQIAQKVGTSYRRNLYNGCKVGKLTISTTGLGLPLEFSADIMAQYISASTSKTFAGLQAVTVGADPAEITTPELKWSANVRYNLGSGLTDLRPDSWKLTVDNHLEAQPGVLQGSSGGPYALAAGNGINEGLRDILFKWTQQAGDEVFTNARLADAPMAAITIPVGANTITLLEGTWDDGALPERQQALYKETHRLRFRGLSIA